MSHPIRDAWIEMMMRSWKANVLSGRIPYGMRGLKFGDMTDRNNHVDGRIPYGMRGLKCRHDRRPHTVHGRRIPYGMRGLK